MTTTTVTLEFGTAARERHALDWARIDRLRELALAFANDPDPTERGWAVMRAYDEYAAHPAPIRRARAVAAALESKTLVLDEGDLIAGRLRRGIAAHPGIWEGYRWANAVAYPDLIRNPAAIEEAPVAPEYAAFLREWSSRHTTPAQAIVALRPDETRRAMDHRLFGAWGLDMVHRLPRFQLLLHEGVVGLRARILEQMRALDNTQPGDIERRCQYEALLIICEALVSFSERWAAHLEELASRERDSARKDELIEMARICRRVPAQPATTFNEALQCIMLALCANEAETSGSAHSLGRLDQYLYPYYEADIAAGRQTGGEALERILCLWLKCYRTFDFHHTTLGGLTPEGKDGTNALSYLCLEAVAHLRTPRDVAVRVHRDTPRAFLRLAADVARLGLGRPDFWSDEITIESLTRSGFPIEDARDYAPIGCVELTIPGKCNSRTMGHEINLTKVLEVTLNGGHCQITGERMGLEQEAAFESYAALHAAYRCQARHTIDMAMAEDARHYGIQSRELPFPLLSLLTEGCIDSGRDVMNGGAIYSPAGVNLFGIANAADSLLAIRRAVYEEKRLTLEELRRALTSDFEGRAALRQQLLTHYPKWGNDDEAVDAIAAKEAAFYCDTIRSYRTPEGGPCLPLIFGCTPASVRNFGPKTGASADGRRCGAALATSVNPTHGRELSGITAELRSVARIDYRKASGGVSFIVDLHPTAVDGDAGLEKLVDLLRGFFDLGGMEIGLNVLRADQLRQAQREPERYGHLMVRVFGFSAPFNSLDAALQEAVIAKTKHET